MTHRTSLRARLSCLLLAAGAVMAVAGCAPGGQADVDLPPKNRAAWTMPLDEFATSNSFARDYAEALLIEPCMTEAGFAYDVPWQPVERGLGESYSAGGQRLFSRELAERFGYHTAPNDWENKEAWRRFGQALDATAASTAGFDERLVDCRETAREELPVVSDEALYYATEAVAQTYDDAVASESVRSSLPAWRECLLGAGFADLADDPEQMPVASLAERWQIVVPDTRPTADEIAMAVADAECSEQSGWNEALYEAQWNAQVEFVQRNADRLVRIRDELSANREALEAVIVSNAPAR